MTLNLSFVSVPIPILHGRVGSAPFLSFEFCVLLVLVLYLVFYVARITALSILD